MSRLLVVHRREIVKDALQFAQVQDVYLHEDRHSHQNMQRHIHDYAAEYHGLHGQGSHYGPCNHVDIRYCNMIVGFVLAQLPSNFHSYGQGTITLHVRNNYDSQAF